MNGRMTIAGGCMVVLAGIATAAPQVTFDVHPRALTLGESAEAIFTISGVNNPPPPTMPEMKSIQVQPNVNRSFQTSIVNSRVTRTATYRYRLLPHGEGTFPVGPVEYTLAGKTYTLPAVEIQVAPRPEAGATSRASLQDRLFATLTCEHPAYYTQESFDVVLSLYSRGLRFGTGLRLTDLPSSGLAFREFREIDAGREVIDDVVYDVQRYRSQARGITSGVFQVQPSLTVPLRVQRQGQQSISRFDQFFASIAEPVEPVTVLPKLLTLEIKALPEADRPDSFSGAVGQFSFQVHAQPQQLQAGDPVTLTMQIQGQGNMDAVSAPALDLGEEFKTYDSRLVSKRMNDNRTRGEKVFEKVIIPRSDEIHEIPELEFSFFEPKSATYQILQQGPFQLEISANSNAVARVIQAAPDGDVEPAELAVIKDDIRYLQSAPPQWSVRTGPAWYARTGWRRVQILPPVLALALALATRHRRALEGDQARSRRRRAPKQASAGLQTAREARAKDDNRDFFQAVWDALSTYFGDRLNLSPGDVSAERVAERFREAGMNDEQIARMYQIFASCEQVRFSHGLNQAQDMTDSDRRNADIILEELEAVLKDCERARL